MILEMVRATVVEGSEAAFEAAVAEFRPLVEAAKGCHGQELHRIIETPGEYLLLVRWETLEDHIVGFRGSPAWVQWRELAGPLLAAPPEIWHTQAV